MNKLRAVLRIVGRIAALLLVVVVALYLIFLAVNWNDRPVGPADARLAQLSRNRPAPDESDNGFVYMRGLGAVHDERRAVQRERDPRFQPLGAACIDADLACFRALEGGDAVIRAWLKEDQWLLERYLVLIERRGWLAPAPLRAGVDINAASAASQGQRLLLMQAWLLAGKGDAAGVRELLEKDLRFWRMMLASADDTMTKSVAGWSFHRNLQLGQVLLRKLPAALQPSAVPPQWRAPVTLQERSLLRSMAGEQQLSNGNIQTTLSQFKLNRDPVVRVLWKLMSPAVQPQNVLNRIAGLTTAVSDTLDVPHRAFPDAVRRAQALVRKARDDAFDNWIYDLPGSYFMRRLAPDFTAYGVRMADLEGARVAALLAAELRAQGVAAGQVPAALATAPSRNPYDQSPFTWDAARGMIVFIGLEPGPRGRHSFLY